MLSFPFNSSSMVMWVNRDALKKAGLDPDNPPKTWPEVFEAGKKLKAAGIATCGFSTAWTTWANIEQFSAWHNVPLSTKANGLDGFDTELKFNRPLHVKHLQNLIDLQKDKTFDYSGRTNTGEGRFTSGECPLFLTSSGFYGNVKGNAKFDSAPRRCRTTPTSKARRRTRSSAAPRLWVMGGKSDDEYKGVAKFFTFLSDTDRQAKLHQETGYLPITRGGLRQDQGVRLLRQEPRPRDALLELTNKEPTENSRGLRLGNMAQLRDVWAEEIEAALAGRNRPRTRWMPPLRAATHAAPVRARAGQLIGLMRRARGHRPHPPSTR